MKVGSADAAGVNLDQNLMGTWLLPRPVDRHQRTAYLS